MERKEKGKEMVKINQDEKEQIREEERRKGKRKGNQRMRWEVSLPFLTVV